MSLFGKVSTSHLFYVWAMKAFAKENYILFYSVVFWIVECGKIFAFISERETGGGGGWGSIHDSRIWKTLTSTDHLQKINNDWGTIHLSILISVPFIHSLGLSLECFDADRRSLERKKLNENSHRSPSFYCTSRFSMTFNNFYHQSTTCIHIRIFNKNTSLLHTKIFSSLFNILGFSIFSREAKR